MSRIAAGKAPGRNRGMSAALLLIAAMAMASCGEQAPAGAPPERSAPAAEAAPPSPPARAPDTAEIVPIEIATDEGTITVALDRARAPITADNFLRYVDAGSFDDIFFYRAAPTPGAPDRGFIQGGIRGARRRMFAPIAHEPTSETGITHEEGTISMARNEGRGAMAEFFITTAAMPQMDASGGEEGYAAFGRVTEGMDVVRRILAAPADPDEGRGAMRGQMIAEPVPIVSVRRAE